ncbi:DNA excision repair protein ERCC-5 [Microdochium nivale]|nr:DNA excision repair protein ERCC-5 [Microdochium nivale]
MGVNGLWTVLQPCARPTNLATLNRKRLAVDASIWIYQFLKAVRDKEGNALRNSHVVGFFRRICKLLWFGVRPVFVFDGGAPALKRQTIMNRKRRREGRRDDAVRTAGKLLAVQMQRIAEEEGDKRRRMTEMENNGVTLAEVETEEVIDESKLIYVDELGMSQQERQKSRKFYKQDAYHLPELGGSIDSMGRPEDPRIMSVEELEEYARQFHSGEDINLYDFSKIDFEGDFFRSLPPADRYNILNAARLRSRLRMGLSKEQLDDMFPDRMAFSRFQIERVKERNNLTQRLMKEAGMTGLDLTLGGSSRIAGERDREYILVKNEGAEGGWALGVVSKDKDRGEIHKPIDVDALDFQYQAKDEQEWEDENEDDFEDIPIEGLNRLPKLGAAPHEQIPSDDGGGGFMAEDDEESLFVAGDEAVDMDNLYLGNRDPQGDQDDDVSRAIELSLRIQHGKGQPQDDEDDDIEFEDVPAPEWKQKAAIQKAKPVTSTSGKAIAHIVNSRANAAVPKLKPTPSAPFQDSDSDDDLAAALSKVKKNKASLPASKPQHEPIRPNVKNPFNGPLPFEKLNWKSSIFASKTDKPEPASKQDKERAEAQQDDDMAGGFERGDDLEASAEEAGPNIGATEDTKPRPLPPWMIQEDEDIRESVRAQRDLENEINEADREAAMEEEKRRRKENFIEIDSSDNESDVEILDQPPIVRRRGEQAKVAEGVPVSPVTLTRISPPSPDPFDGVPQSRKPEMDANQTTDTKKITLDHITQETAIPFEPTEASSPEPDFEEVEIMQPPEEASPEQIPAAAAREPEFEDNAAVEPPRPEAESEAALGRAEETTIDASGFDGAINFEAAEQQIFDDYDDEFSDPEDEQLLAQMAEEAEEHARFASQLTNKSATDDQEAYERELKALRTQQKKDRRDADEVTQIMITECQALLRYFGIPYITAPMEAEAQCAELVSLGLVDGIVTDDSDIFLFGGTRVYKNMFNSNKFVECYLASDLEKELSLGREQLIAIAQLLGSDYTDGLPGVGPVTAVEILSEFPGREGLSAFKDWWQDIQMNSRPKEADAKSTFRRKFRKSQATKLFLPPAFPSDPVFEAYLKPDVDSDPESFQWGVPDVEGLRQFLMQTIGWSQERTDEILVPVIRDMNRREVEGTQSNITRFFEGSVGVGARQQQGQQGTTEAFAPRQKAKTSKRMVEAVNRLRSHAVVESLGGEQAQADEDAQNDSAQSTAGSGKRKRRAGRKAATVLDDDNDDDGAGDDNESYQAGPSRSRAKKAKARS